jgi:hypothetical protein
MIVAGAMGQDGHADRDIDARAVFVAVESIRP